MTDRKRIAILGSTGSIGTQTLDIIDEHPELFEASLLTAGTNWELLATQARRYRPSLVVIADDSCYPALRDELRDTGIEVAAGSEAIRQAAASAAYDYVVTAMVGYSGLAPTLEAISRGKRICLANKETLVAAGSIVTREAALHNAEIVPVDSEHSAIFQCLRGETTRTASKIILTASGGPFRQLTAEQLGRVTVADALHHPNWNMGAKVTIDSASMMNKGLEMIEAHWLFGCPAELIEIVVHPQSIVHSMVEFVDGSIMAQIGVPDMRTPIRFALGYPDRIPSARPPLRLGQYSNLTFEAPDTDRFPLLRTAFRAIGRGGTAPCAMNAANEVAVRAFLDGRIRFTDMPRIVDTVTARAAFEAEPDYDAIISADAESRALAAEVLHSMTSSGA